MNAKTKPVEAPAQEKAPNPAPVSEPTAENDTGPTLIRKMSAKTIIGNVRKFVNLDSPDVTPLYSVIGVTHGIKDGTGDNGPWVAFLGSFEGVNYHTGEVFRGGQCFVPKAIEDILIATVRAQQKGDDSASVQFAIEVGVKSSDTSIGYEYTVKSLLKMEGADPLAAIRSRLPAPPKMKALAAPAQTV